MNQNMPTFYAYLLKDTTPYFNSTEPVICYSVSESGNYMCIFHAEQPSIADDLYTVLEGPVGDDNRIYSAVYEYHMAKNIVPQTVPAGTDVSIRMNMAANMLCIVLGEWMAATPEM